MAKSWQMSFLYWENFWFSERVFFRELLRIIETHLDSSPIESFQSITKNSKRRMTDEKLLTVLILCSKTFSLFIPTVTLIRVGVSHKPTIWVRDSFLFLFERHTCQKSYPSSKSKSSKERCSSDTFSLGIIVILHSMLLSYFCG